MVCWQISNFPLNRQSLSNVLLALSPFFQPSGLLLIHVIIISNNNEINFKSIHYSHVTWRLLMKSPSVKVFKGIVNYVNGFIVNTSVSGETPANIADWEGELRLHVCGSGWSRFLSIFCFPISSFHPFYRWVVDSWLMLSEKATKILQS
jgi:hypothetical protein